jgi:DNA-3-methyladenine glycosylase I
MQRRRCGWVNDDPLMIAYHDREWGRPVHDDHTLFEFLILEGAQAGLSWRTILHKRDAYRRAYDGFDPRRVARYDARKVRALLADAGIVRNRLKIAASIDNARAFLRVQHEHKSFDRFAWSFVGTRPRVNRPPTMRDIPARTTESDAFSAALRSRGFRFVGSTILYAFMQAVGMVNDHTRDCYLAKRR